MCHTSVGSKILKTGGEIMDKKKEALKLAERIARLKVEGDSYRWPPICAGFLHQPKRPKAVKKN